MKRKCSLVTDHYYHIFARSIAEFKIFNNDTDYLRMLNLFRFYQIKDPPAKYSIFFQSALTQKLGFIRSFNLLTKNQERNVDIVAYCLMPTHLHIILKQLIDGGISSFMRKILNSYSCYFNLEHHRNGPLWESRFKNILIDTDEQLLHLSRYIHSNPSSAELVVKPEQWEYSSYLEYLGKDVKMPLANFKEIIDMSPHEYKQFVEDRISYQKELSKIKRLLLDE